MTCNRWAECYAALAHITNKIPKGFPRNPHAASVRDEVIGLIMKAEDVPIIIRRAARAVILGPTDSMCLGVWAVGRTIWRQRDCWMTIEPDEMPVEDVVNGLPAATFDMHTRDGKLALKAFYTSLCKVYPEIKQIPELRAVSALGYVVFFDEGAKVDRRIRSDWLNALMNWQEKSCCAAYGVPEHLVDRVREIVGKEFPRLHQRRHWAVKMFAE